MSTTNLTTRSVEWPPLDYSKQAIPVPGTKKPGQSAHYRNAVFGYINQDTPNAMQTLTELWDIGLAVGKDRPFLGHRPVVSTKPLVFGPYVWQTYGQIAERRKHVGSAIYEMFAKGELGGGELETVGIWSQNRPEWQVIDLALQGYQKITVSLYDTLGKDSVVIFATKEHIPTLLKLAPRTTLKLIVSIDDLSEDSSKILKAWAEVQKVKIIQLRDLEAIGKAKPIEPISATREQIASICYTSGTTSNPKGVVLTHGHMALACQSNLYGPGFGGDAVLLSYLPLAHIYERLAESLAISLGSAIGYFTGDPLRLLDDAQTLKPHFFPSVPRVLNRVYQGAMLAGDVQNFRGTIFRKAVASKLETLRTTGVNTHAVWDKLVFRKVLFCVFGELSGAYDIISQVRAVLGGRLQLVTSGSAPISSDVMNFLKIALCCEVTEGYGMTENCATCCRALPGDPGSSGTVGPPQPINEVKLLDVPAMGYSADNKPNPRGELCVRGNNCFSVYYKDEKNTKETVDAEGWIHTGDVAEIDSCGRVKIIDRVKNIMKLAQGEYVALEKIENLYSSSPVVAQLYVHGDGLQSYLIGVLVPDPVQLAQVASNVLGAPVSESDTAALKEAAAHPKVNQAILAIITQEAKKNSLKGFETIRRIHISLEPFSVDNNTMTPTMKIRRKDAQNMYKSELDALYALGDPSGNQGFKL
ncbi:hypothetical protein HWV62_10094 [Athelia sp. TMB]|nr:hypothetical protein HWV62_10094 [Athelia sp. TMB]